MRNRLLSVIRDSIPYIKQLRPYVDSVTAAILMQQLDYWFERFPDGFYKFLEPCDNKKYQTGDSWIEELGFSKAEFRSAFDNIGVRYESKKAFSKTNDRSRFTDKTGRSKFYASYHDRIKGLTFYYRNHEAVDALLDKICSKMVPPVNQESGFTEGKTVDLRKSRNSIYVKQESGFTINKESEITTETTTENTSKILSAGAETSEQPLLSNASKSGKQNPLSNSSHPMVKFYRDLSGLNKLNRVQIDQIAETVTDETVWRTVITERALRGWNPSNIAGALEQYHQLARGIPAEQIFPTTTKGQHSGSDQNSPGGRPRRENLAERNARIAKENLDWLFGAGEVFDDGGGGGAGARETESGGQVIDLKSARRLPAKSN